MEQTNAWPEYDRLLVMIQDPERVKHFHAALVEEFERLGQELYTRPDGGKLLRAEYTARITALQSLMNRQVEWLVSLLNDTQREELDS